MRIEKIKIADLIKEVEYIISIPVDPELHGKFQNDFPGTPPIIVNPEMVILSGYDSYMFFLDKGVEYSEVLISDLDEKESLFLSYNSRSLLKPLSLYEKLNFLKNIIKYSDVQEIYQRTDLGIKIDKLLISMLPELTGEDFRTILSSDLLSLRTAVRLCSLEKKDRDVLFDLFSKVKFSRSNEQNLLDMIGEICFREKISVKDVFQKINIKELIENENPGSGILSAVSRVRYPEFRDYEDGWKQEVSKIKFPFRFTVHHSPFFEKKGVELRLFLDSLEDVKDISKKLKD